MYIEATYILWMCRIFAEKHFERVRVCCFTAVVRKSLRVDSVVEQGREGRKSVPLISGKSIWAARTADGKALRAWSMITIYRRSRGTQSLFLIEYLIFYIFHIILCYFYYYFTFFMLFPHLPKAFEGDESHECRCSFIPYAFIEHLLCAYSWPQKQ